jgi:hypothetical protein
MLGVREIRQITEARFFGIVPTNQECSFCSPHSRLLMIEEHYFGGTFTFLSRTIGGCVLVAERDWVLSSLIAAETLALGLAALVSGY